MSAATTVNSWTKVWGLTLFSLGAIHLFPAQAQQDTAIETAEQGDGAQHHKHHTYTLIDLGTFGGPQSFVNIPNGYAPVLNNSGTVAGWADTAVPDPHPNICFQIPDCHVEHAFLSKGIGKTDLGSLPGPVPTSSQPNWIADGGLIAGVSENGELDPLVPGFPEVRAVLWRKNGIVNLGTLDGGYESVANAVNEDGQVVGLFTNTVPDANSMFGLGYQTRAFSWKDGIMQGLGTLGGTNAQALLVNERGQVVGASYLNSNPSPACAPAGLNLATGAFLWEKGQMQNLGSLGGTCTFPTDLNNRGQIVGNSSLPDDHNFHAFLWENGTMTDLGNTFGGVGSSAIAINEAGHVVGWGQPAGDKPLHASLWKNGLQIDLGTFGTDCAFADTINSKDQIAGVSYPNCNFEMPGRGFIYENGELVDLNSLIPPGSKLHISVPETINDRGEIAGSGVTSDGTEHAFLLIPNVECEDHCECGGNCCDENCEDSIATSQSNAAIPAQAAPAADSDSTSRLRNRFGRPARRSHIAGLGASIALFNMSANAVNTHQIKLNWQITFKHQTGYDIYRCQGCSDPLTQGTKIASVVGWYVFTYTDGTSSNPLTQATTYTYQVTATTSRGELGRSNPASATTQIEPAPTNLTSVGIEYYGRGHGVRLNWTNNSTDDDSYHIEACSGSTCTNFGEIARIAANATSYLEYLYPGPDGTFRYRVRTHSPGGYSAYSNIRTQILP